jgi:hypothetical protein
MDGTLLDWTGVAPISIGGGSVVRTPPFVVAILCCAVRRFFFRGSFIQFDDPFSLSLSGKSEGHGILVLFVASTLFSVTSFCDSGIFGFSIDDNDNDEDDGNDDDDDDICDNVAVLGPSWFWYEDSTVFFSSLEEEDVCGVDILGRALSVVHGFRPLL